MTGEHESGGTATAAERTRLFKVRETLLDLHKTLLNVERKRYERNVGPVTNEFEFFRLATSDPSFEWIGPLTTLIVQIDEKAASKEPITTSEIDELYTEIRSVVASPTETSFQQQYNQLLQDHPDLVMQHSAVMQALPPAKRSKSS